MGLLMVQTIRGIACNKGLCFVANLPVITGKLCDGEVPPTSPMSSAVPLLIRSLLFASHPIQHMPPELPSSCYDNAKLTLLTLDVLGFSQFMTHLHLGESSMINVTFNELFSIYLFIEIILSYVIIYLIIPLKLWCQHGMSCSTCDCKL